MTHFAVRPRPGEHNGHDAFDSQIFAIMQDHSGRDPTLSAVSERHAAKIAI
jgi:hypothetical protein